MLRLRGERGHKLTKSRRTKRVGVAFLLAAGAALTSCGSSLSVSQIESQIERNLNLQVAGEASLNTLPGSGTTTASASVSCPKNANVMKGSVFYCAATITTTTNPPAGSADFTPKLDFATRRVKVTMTSDSKAHWEVQ